MNVSKYTYMYEEQARNTLKVLLNHIAFLIAMEINEYRLKLKFVKM